MEIIRRRIQFRWVNLAASIITGLTLLVTTVVRAQSEGSAVGAKVARLPTQDDVLALQEDLTKALEAFKQNPSSETFQPLRRIGQTYKQMAGIVGKAVESSSGGAMTKNVQVAHRLVSDAGISLQEAFLFFELNNNPVFTGKPELEQLYEDVMVNLIAFEVAQLQFKALRDKVDERSVDGRVTWGDVFRRTMREVPRDLLGLFRFGRNRSTGEIYWGPAENMRRQAAIEAMIERFSAATRTEIPVYNQLHDGDSIFERDRHEERLAGLLLWLTDRAVNIRMERSAAQTYATVFYFASGLFLGVFPVANYFGDAYTAHFETAIVNLSALWALAVTKYLMSGTRTLREWIELNAGIRETLAQGLIAGGEAQMRQALPGEYFPAQVPLWHQKRLAFHKAADELGIKIRRHCGDAISFILRRPRQDLEVK